MRIRFKETMYLISLDGVEWSIPQEIWSNKKEADKRCEQLQDSLDHRDPKRKNFTERNSLYVVAPVNHKCFEEDGK